MRFVVKRNHLVYYSVTGVHIYILSKKLSDFVPSQLAGYTSLILLDVYIK